MQKILAITWLTWKAAVRFKLFLVIAALLVAAVVGLPLVIKDDGTAQGFTQIILTYTLSVATGLLGISTLWLSCGTLARDIEECQIQVVATKPVARWQIWLGKWLGIVSLNAVLLLIAGGCVYGLLQWRATRLPPAEQVKLRSSILVARGSAREASQDAKIEADTREVLTRRVKQNPEITRLSEADKAEVIRQISEQVKAVYQLVPPAYTRVWKIDLGFAKDSLRGKPLQLRIKFNNANDYQPTTYMGAWLVGDATSKNVWRSEPMSLASQTFHEFEIPPDLFNDQGILTISFYNPNRTALLFPLDDGLEVLYPEGSFALNFLRGLAVIFCWMALLAALGLAAASFLSFPVAAFFSMAMLALVFSSGTLAETVAEGTVGVGNEEKGIAGHSAFDVLVIPLFKGIVAVTDLTKTVSPIDSLSTGRMITWSQLWSAFSQVVLLLGGIFAI
ncbi:MAG TPA: ABC transporter permease, partial [Desulfuromonadaceae bacterium]|nr:ABC transporter permease [Desulfuromonadaceae bacterium]